MSGRVYQESIRKNPVTEDEGHHFTCLSDHFIAFPNETRPAIRNQVRETTGITQAIVGARRCLSPTVPCPGNGDSAGRSETLFRPTINTVIQSTRTMRRNDCFRRGDSKSTLVTLCHIHTRVSPPLGMSMIARSFRQVVSGNIRESCLTPDWSNNKFFR